MPRVGQQHMGEPQECVRVFGHRAGPFPGIRHPRFGGRGRERAGYRWTERGPSGRAPTGAGVAAAGISKQTAREAISELEGEGLVEVVRRRGTVVRPRPARRRITRSRQVHRDERGYSFDPSAQTWTALEPPTISWAAAPHDIAALLGVPIDEDVLVRNRLMA